MRHHKLIYTSSPDRGLDILLTMWPAIKAKFPDATLDVAYGWEIFDQITVANAERQEWKRNVVEAMKQDGITDHGRIGKQKLVELRDQCGIWAYPTYFTEIFCMNAIESQAQGVVPVVIRLASLPEVTGSGVLIDGDVYDKQVQEKFLNELLALMGNEERWKAESKKAKEFAKNYSWDKTAELWDKELQSKDVEDVKVHIYTPTIRRGFWNVMAHNIANQTYRNIEWIIVDDFPDDRSKTAQKYAKKYGISIKYLRSRPRTVKRRYGLVNANNTALENMDDGLMVFLQDFVIMPYDGIEQLVRLYRKNKDALIAPVDIYHAPKVKPNTESEDWFNGQLDIVGNFMWQNARIMGIGLRTTTNPFDFEQNYGAIPVKIAKELGGWWEFFDFGLGFDNTSIAYAALKAGYRILVDDTNIAVCIDHWQALKGKDENGGMERGRRLNDPLFIWYKEMVDSGRLPIFRKQEIDDKIDLQYEAPAGLSDEEFTKKWLPAHGAQIAMKWLEEVKL